MRFISPRINRFSRPTLFAVLALSLALPRAACALQVTGYTTAANDRFESGLPSDPVESSSASFIGKGYDWSGAGWDSTNLQKGFGFLSPRHYLVASHYLGSTYVNVNDQDSDLAQGTQQGVEATGYGIKADGTNPDISIATLTQPLPSSAPIARYAVLDLNSTSTTNTPTAYNNLAVLLYGRGATTTSSPRIGATTIYATTVSGTDTYFRTLRTDVQLEGGDSGSPAFYGWTNPNGGQELTLLGLNSAIDTTNGYNFISFLGNSGVINAMNALMVDNGFALRVVGNVSNTWAGSSSTSITNRRAWAISSTPSDVYVKFDAATASSRSVTVDSNANLRGIYFKETATAGDSFTFAGASTLTIGRGGITNYDNARQSFSANMTLGDHQYWDAGTGGVTITNLNTNGKLLEITGSATISGAISGSGGIALTSGTLALASTSTYTGATTVNGGKLTVSGVLNSTSGIMVNSGGTLLLDAAAAAPGRSVTLAGGTLAAGAGLSNSLGMLTLSASSTIDFSGSASGELLFSSLTYTAGILNITNWGTFGSQSTLGFSSDAGLAAFVSHVSFEGGFPAGIVQTSISEWDIVAVPEPGTIATGLALLGFVVWRERRRLRSLAVDRVGVPVRFIGGILKPDIVRRRQRPPETPAGDYRGMHAEGCRARGRGRGNRWLLPKADHTWLH